MKVNEGVSSTEHKWAIFRTADQVLPLLPRFSVHEHPVHTFVWRCKPGSRVTPWVTELSWDDPRCRWPGLHQRGGVVDARSTEHIRTRKRAAVQTLNGNANIEWMSPYESSSSNANSLQIVQNWGTLQLERSSRPSFRTAEHVNFYRIDIIVVAFWLCKYCRSCIGGQKVSVSASSSCWLAQARFFPVYRNELVLKLIT